MEAALQVVFRNLEPSEALTAKINERVAWLEEVCDRIISCRVAVEAPHRHHRQGNIYRVRINVRVPGKEVVVSRRPDLHDAHQDMHVVIHDAFDEARRALEDYSNWRKRGRKRTEPANHAIVIRLVEEESDFGFLRAEDGREFYFNSSSVLGGKFKDLEIGSEVRFTEEMGEKGPQASTVDLIGKQGHRFEKVFRSPS